MGTAPPPPPISVLLALVEINEICVEKIRQKFYSLGEIREPIKHSETDKVNKASLMLVA
jgi:hypothetical protein